MIKQFLSGKEESAGKIKAYKHSLIQRVEKTKLFKKIMVERTKRQQKRRLH